MQFPQSCFIRDNLYSWLNKVINEVHRVIVGYEAIISSGIDRVGRFSNR